MDPRLVRLAHLLVDYSVNVQPGDRVWIEATTAAEDAVRAVFQRVLEKGGHPQILLTFPEQEALFLEHADGDQLDLVPPFAKLAADEFECRIRFYSETNTRSQTNSDSAKAKQRQKALSQVQQVVMRRGANGSMRWLSTGFPTIAYAMEADMSLSDYEDFVYGACHVDDRTPDPVAYWQQTERDQAVLVDRLAGHDVVTLKGPDVDLRLSIKGRTFMNSCGHHNMPDGEIFTGPVEPSVEGWVRFTYPAVYGGRVVEGVELTFQQGKVIKATAKKNQNFLHEMLSSDNGAVYLGEFAIGTNFGIDRFTKNILFDEKIGGTFHMALGAGYPETGSVNKSAIHWDMICDMRQDATITVDGDLFYKDGAFVS